MDQERAPSLGARGRQARPTKWHVFWSCAASVLATIVLGFGWGGWVTGGTAQRAAIVASDDAVLRHLVPLCVVQFEQDTARDAKLRKLKASDGWVQGDYVRRQGWATMPGESGADGRVAEACARALVSRSLG
jgi:hypothetical protein